MDMNKMNVFTFDAETNGLTGRAFSIGAVIYKDGKEVKTFYARTPIEGDIDPFVRDHVLPQMEGMQITHQTYEGMLADFASFFLKEKEGAHVIFHMGCPVEARIIIDMHDLGLLGPFEGAYPWLDVAGMLLQAGFDPTSVDSYNREHGIEVPQPEPGGTHNPLYDSRAAALCFMDLMKRRRDCDCNGGVER